MKKLTISIFILSLLSVNIFFTAAQEVGDVYLTEGLKGLLYVYLNSAKGPVCDDSSGIPVGQVACRNLGATLITITYSNTGPTNNFLLDDVVCNGTESNLAECNHSPWGSHNCGSSEHFYVECDVDECQTDNGGCSHTCINTPGSFYCECPDHFYLTDNNRDCIDVNECQTDNGGCSHTCINTIGSFYCECPDHFYLSGNNRDCIDVNECVEENGGCSHNCVNTEGSYYCECPEYLYLSDHKTCSANGTTIDCSSSHEMKVTLDKRTLFFLPDQLTLLDTQCVSNSNSTHIWLQSDYDKCSTSQKTVDDTLVFSNTILSSDDVAAGSVMFYDLIYIPFKCVFAATSNITQVTAQVPRLIMRLENQGSLQRSLNLYNNQSDDSVLSPPIELRQRETLYAKLEPDDSGLKLIPDECTVYSEQRAASQRVIENGLAATSFTEVHASDGYQFSYPAFTFKGEKGKYTLNCNYSINVLTTPSFVVSPEEIAQETVTGYCHGLNQTQESNITIANETVRVLCDLDTPNGPWITILKHTAGSGLFNKDFATFERGFGDVNHDHFIGLRLLHLLSHEQQIELRVTLGDGTSYAQYDDFKVGGPETQYMIQELSGYQGTAGVLTDELSQRMMGTKFSTYDRDNDQWTAGNCSGEFSNIGWWYDQCHHSCLTCEPIAYYHQTMPSKVSMKVKVNEEDAEQTINTLSDQSEVVDSSQVKLTCTPTSMHFSINSSVLVGLSPLDLQPLIENCQGFTATTLNGQYEYSIPLLNCGAQIQVEGGDLVVTNSLVYSSNISSEVKHFSDIILTQSCRYPLNNLSSSVEYTVRPENYTFSTENEAEAYFDVQLDVFTDKEFRNLLETDSAISIHEGTKLFGELGISTSNSDLRVSPKDCKLTPTSNANDPAGQMVIQNGCRTGYAVQFLSSNKFSILSTIFVPDTSKNSYLHCSVNICEVDDMSRCERSCPPLSDIGNTLG